MFDQLSLDKLWDFSDAAGSEARFRAAMDADGMAPADAAELATQLARALGLQGRFGEAAAVLDAVAPHEPVVAVRIELERGRLFNSSGHGAAAIAHFELAAALAHANGLHFLQVDALHMLAIADTERSAHWTAAGLAAVDAATGNPEQVRRTARWRVGLLNNRGWSLRDAGDDDGAVAAFRGALAAALEVGTAEQQEYARQALDEAQAAADEK
ncbi:hypothetical protein ACQCSX_15735 [Pseudarthrobacter sp. P1]|uniref:hypothetical protein n=1 Tax=Pseudarthrobacter sp. P1 TaxID=3418418 RepID=UPI003CE9C7E8